MRHTLYCCATTTACSLNLNVLPPGGARGLQLCRGGELLHHADHPQLESEREGQESDPAEQEQGTGEN